MEAINEYRRELVNSFNPSQAQVIDSIRAANGLIMPDVEKMVGYYPKWQLEAVTTKQIGSLTWYLDENPEHISHILTNRGRNREVWQVAERYNQMDSQVVSWNHVRKIEELVELIQIGALLSPLVIVPGSRYPNSPESSFIDGVHRSLAAMVAAMRSGKDIQLGAYIGSKDSILNRVLAKIR